MSKDELKRIAAHIQSPYADSEEAVILMGLDNVKHLAKLHAGDHLPRYRIGSEKSYKYLKEECLKCAEKIRKGEIVINPI